MKAVAGMNPKRPTQRMDPEKGAKVERAVLLVCGAG